MHTLPSHRPDRCVLRLGVLMGSDVRFTAAVTGEPSACSEASRSRCTRASSVSLADLNARSNRSAARSNSSSPRRPIRRQHSAVWSIASWACGGAGAQIGSVHRRSDVRLLSMRTSAYRRAAGAALLPDATAPTMRRTGRCRASCRIHGAGAMPDGHRRCRRDAALRRRNLLPSRCRSRKPRHWRHRRAAGR